MKLAGEVEEDHSSASVTYFSKVRWIRAFLITILTLPEFVWYEDSFSHGSPSQASSEGLLLPMASWIAQDEIGSK